MIARVSLRTIARQIRPAEWALIGFAVYAVARIALAHNLTINSRSIPPITLIVPFVAVVTVRLLVRYRATPWPPEFEHRRKMHNVMLGIFMSCAMLCMLGLPPVNAMGGTIAPILVKLDIWIWSLIACAITPLFVWVLHGLHLKKHGRVRASFFLETAAIIGPDVRAWLPPLSLIFAYGLMGTILAQPLFPDRDEQLWAIDRWLFAGHDPHLMVEHLISRPLSEWLAVAYVSYTFLYPITLAAIFAKRDPICFEEVSFAMTFSLAVGYILYTIVPAQGPVFTQHHEASLDLYYIGFVKEQLMDRTRVPRDCFPSLHTCVGLVFLYYLLKHVRWLGVIWAPLVISIPFACVYLRYHYVIDVIAGVVLFASTVALQRRIFARETKPEALPIAHVAPATDHP
jgi:hypothetical protein